MRGDAALQIVIDEAQNAVSSGEPLDRHVRILIGAIANLLAERHHAEHSPGEVLSNDLIAFPIPLLRLIRRGLPSVCQLLEFHGANGTAQATRTVAFRLEQLGGC